MTTKNSFRKSLIMLSAIAALSNVVAGEFIKLWDKLPTKSTKPKDVPGFEVFPAPAAKSNGIGILVCPGGGYRRICSDHEGVKAAQWLNSKGISAFVLRYRLPVDGYRHPVPLDDARRALQMIRLNAEKWRLDPGKIGIMGFSAGGHLAAHASTDPVAGKKDAADPVGRVSSRPDFSILVYPCITAEKTYAYGGIFQLIKDTKYTKNNISIEKHVTKDTPPVFLVLASNDGVHPMNSVLFFQSCLKNKVPVELHIYRTGGHGFGFSAWPKMSGGSLVKTTWMFRLEDWLMDLPCIKKK